MKLPTDSQSEVSRPATSPSCSVGGRASESCTVTSESPLTNPELEGDAPIEILSPAIQDQAAPDADVAVYIFNLWDISDRTRRPVHKRKIVYFKHRKPRASTDHGEGAVDNATEDDADRDTGSGNAVAITREGDDAQMSSLMLRARLADQEHPCASGSRD